MLIQKFKHIYLSGSAVMWFETYLRVRQQHVSLNTMSLLWHYVNVDVPQGQWLFFNTGYRATARLNLVSVHLSFLINLQFQNLQISC